MKISPTSDLISLVPQNEYVDLDKTLESLFDKYKMARLGGASGKGWSSYSAFQRCPYLFKVKYVDKERGMPGKALEIGSLMHTFLALHYLWMLQEDLQFTPEVCRQELMDAGIRPESIIEAWRLYDHYTMHYQNDYLFPLALEEWAQGFEGNTCRYDMIAKVVGDHPGLPEGAYIIEHKSASRFTGDLFEGWHNDGEVLGQIMIWKQAGLDKKYGKLRGTIVNILGKQKIPQFHRVIVPAQAWHVKEHEKDLKVWNALIEMYKATDTWPRARNNCVHRYGLCDLFSSCSTNEKLTPLRKLDNAVKEARAKDAEQAAPAASTETEKSDAAEPVDPATQLGDPPIAVGTESPEGLDSSIEPSDTTNMSNVAPSDHT